MENYFACSSDSVRPTKKKKKKRNKKKKKRTLRMSLVIYFVSHTSPALLTHGFTGLLYPGYAKEDEFMM